MPMFTQQSYAPRRGCRWKRGGSHEGRLLEPNDYGLVGINCSPTWATVSWSQKLSINAQLYGAGVNTRKHSSFTTTSHQIGAVFQPPRSVCGCFTQSLVFLRFVKESKRMCSKISLRTDTTLRLRDALSQAAPRWKNKRTQPLCPCSPAAKNKRVILDPTSTGWCRLHTYDGDRERDRLCLHCNSAPKTTTTRKPWRVLPRNCQKAVSASNLRSSNDLPSLRARVLAARTEGKKKCSRDRGIRKRSEQCGTSVVEFAMIILSSSFWSISESKTTRVKKWKAEEVIKCQ